MLLKDFCSLGNSRGPHQGEEEGHVARGTKSKPGPEPGPGPGPGPGPWPKNGAKKNVRKTLMKNRGGKWARALGPRSGGGALSL